MSRYMKVAALFLVVALTVGLSACTLSGKAVVATVNGESITKQEFMYFFSQIKSSIEAQQGTDLTADLWESEIDGKKTIDIVKEGALEKAITAKLITKMAMDEGIKLTVEQLSDIDSKVGQYITKYGENGADDYFGQFGYSTAVYRKAWEDSYYSRNLAEKLTADVDEVVAKRFFDEKIFRVKHILLLTIDETTRESLPAETVEAAKARADELLVRARNGADFDKLVAEFSQDPGSKEIPDGYYLGKGFALGGGAMDNIFENASLELEVGGVSDVVETDYGYHIIKRYQNDPKEFDANVEEILDLAKSDRYTKLIESWRSAATVEKNDKEYDAIK